MRVNYVQNVQNCKLQQRRDITEWYLDLLTSADFCVENELYFCFAELPSMFTNLSYKTGLYDVVKISMLPGIYHDGEIFLMK